MSFIGCNISCKSVQLQMYAATQRSKMSANRDCCLASNLELILVQARSRTLASLPVFPLEKPHWLAVWRTAVLNLRYIVASLVRHLCDTDANWSIGSRSQYAQVRLLTDKIGRGKQE